MQLGDMQVIGSPPAKLAKALAVIADTPHPAFAHDPRITPGIWKESCVLCSHSMTAIRQRLTRDNRFRLSRNLNEPDMQKHTVEIRIG